MGHHGNSFLSFGTNGLPVGGWKELGRTTLGSPGDSIQISSIPDKRYYMLLGHTIGVSGAHTQNPQFGSTTIDTGGNYAVRRAGNGGGETLLSNHTSFALSAVSGLAGETEFSVDYLFNLSGNAKLGIVHDIQSETAGASAPPSRSEVTAKWVNTSNPIDISRLFNTGAGDYNTGSEYVILGWDPADTHTDNFWEELDSVDFTSGTGITSNVFTSKKYLWVQGFLVMGANASNFTIQVGNGTIDTASNYAVRRSSNGDTDDPIPTTSILSQFATGEPNDIDDGEIAYLTMFIINNSANEKLAIGHIVAQNTGGSGTAPDRQEFASKWVNTSNLLNVVKIFTNAGTGNPTAGQLKIWGHD